jgi:hypothetical protein
MYIVINELTECHVRHLISINRYGVIPKKEGCSFSEVLFGNRPSTLRNGWSSVLRYLKSELIGWLALASIWAGFCCILQLHLVGKSWSELDLRLLDATSKKAVVVSDRRATKCGAMEPALGSDTVSYVGAGLAQAV